MLNARQLLPARQRVADRVRGGDLASWIEWAKYAVNRPYISMNDPEGGVIKFLAIDCDHEDWDDLPGAMPPPLCTTVTRLTGRHHHVWQLAAPVCITENAHPKPLAYLAAVQTALTWHLRADPHFTNTLTKNPWYGEWSTVWWPQARPVEMREFEPWLLEPGFKLKAANANVALESCGYSRNVDLFDHTRHWAYRNWRGDTQDVYAVAQDFNATFTVPLPATEVAATAKSICKFMSTKYIGKPKGQKRTSTREVKIGAILAAEDSIRASGQRPTIDMVAAITGINRATVSRIQNTL